MAADQAISPGDACMDGPVGLVLRAFEPSDSTADQDAAHPSQAAQRAPQVEERQLNELVTRIAQRDEKALADFFDATRARVYGLALRITDRADAAEEVTADTYLQVWREASRYDAARGKVLAWLLTVCRSRAIDSIRRRDEAHAVAEPDLLRAGEAAEADDPEVLLLALERDCALHAALAGLSAVQRQLLALAFFRGLTHEELAQHTRLPLGSVKTHIRKAIMQLREQLTPAAAGEVR